MIENMSLAKVLHPPSLLSPTDNEREKEISADNSFDKITSRRSI